MYIAWACFRNDKDVVAEYSETTKTKVTIIFKMFAKHVGLTVFTIAAFGFVNATNFKRLAFPDNDVRNHVPGARSSRAVSGPGSAVLRILLKGAEEMSTNDKFNRIFIKHGSKYEAISDFNALNCENVIYKRFGVSGVKGNASFKLKIDAFSQSTIVVSDPNMAKSIKIIYTKTPDQ